MRTRGATASTRTSVKDENASAFGTSSGMGGLSAKDAALLAVGGKASGSQAAVAGKKTVLGKEPSRAAGAKRPALGNISNAGARVSPRFASPSG